MTTVEQAKDAEHRIRVALARRDLEWAEGRLRNAEREVHIAQREVRTLTEEVEARRATLKELT